MTAIVKTANALATGTATFVAAPCIRDDAAAARPAPFPFGEKIPVASLTTDSIGPFRLYRRGFGGAWCRASKAEGRDADNQRHTSHNPSHDRDLPIVS